jgi:hypothetical protein
MVRFRVVILDDFDNVKEVVYESKQEYKNEWDSNWSNDEYEMLIELDIKYDLTDWENAPNLETQVLEYGPFSENEEWYFHSNTIDDWFNL